MLKSSACLCVDFKQLTLAVEKEREEGYKGLYTGLTNSRTIYCIHINYVLYLRSS